MSPFRRSTKLLLTRPNNVTFGHRGRRVLPLCFSRMKKPLETESGAIRTIPVLSVNPNQEDHVVMEGIFSNHFDWVPYEDFDWALYKSKGLASALTELHEHQIAIVIYEEDLYPGSWKDMLELTMQSLTPPLLIVTSRLAD